MRVFPTSAVTFISTVLFPTLRARAPEAAPEDTEENDPPLTLTWIEACVSLAVGVTVSEVAFAPAVYDVVPPLNEGTNEPTDKFKLDKVASLDPAFTVTVYVLLFPACAVTFTSTVFAPRFSGRLLEVEPEDTEENDPPLTLT